MALSFQVNLNESFTVLILLNRVFRRLELDLGWNILPPTLFILPHVDALAKALVSVLTVSGNAGADSQAEGASYLLLDVFLWNVC